MSPVGQALHRTGRMSKFAACLAVMAVLWIPIQIRLRQEISAGERHSSPENRNKLGRFKSIRKKTKIN
jgi:hypothetical protein